MNENSLPKRAGFTALKDITAEDCRIIRDHYKRFVKTLPDRILAHLQLLDGDFGGFPVDRLQHCLQTATLAHQAGENEEYVVCALLHDIGDTLGSYNHGDIAAAILKPFVSEENRWMIEHHGIFQGYYFFHHLGLDRNLREQFREHPCFERTLAFCANYDNPAFDPHRETMPLDAFVPMLRRVFEAPKRSIYNAML
ncbi:MAG: HD domain-containing protein [Gammaproteobacteria bacterium]